MFTVLGNISNKSKLVYEEIKSLLNSGICLLPFGPVSFAVPFAIQNYKDLNVQKDIYLLYYI